jgi:hypothetical protein
MSASEMPAGSGGPAGTERVLVQGLTPDDLTPVQKRLVQKYRLVDRGDHVEWTDGKKVQRWRLSDQGNADPSLPVLAGVARLHSSSAVVSTVKAVRPIYCDPSGAFLAFACAPRMWIRELSEKCYPPAVFGPLTERGVTLADESMATVMQVEKAHPGMSTNKALSFYRRHALLVIVAAFVVAIVIAEIIAFSR